MKLIEKLRGMEAPELANWLKKYAKAPLVGYYDVLGMLLSETREDGTVRPLFVGIEGEYDPNTPRLLRRVGGRADMEAPDEPMRPCQILEHTKMGNTDYVRLIDLSGENPSLMSVPAFRVRTTG